MQIQSLLGHLGKATPREWSDGIKSGWGVSYAKTLQLISARSFRDRGAGHGCNPSNLGHSPSREIFLSLLKVVRSLSTEEVYMDINVC